MTTTSSSPETHKGAFEPPTAGTAPSSDRRPGRLARILSRMPRSAWPLLVFALLFLIGGLIRPNLLSLDSLIGTATFAMILAIASFGQTAAVIQGGIDLSVPNTIAFSALSYLTLIGPLGPVGGFIGALAAGTVIGIINGTIVAKLGLTPIVTTIAMNGLLFGVVLLTFKNSELTVIPPFLTDITATKIDVFGLSVAAVLPLGLVLMVILQLVLSYTGWGRSLFLVGSAPETAKLAGQPVDRIRIAGYALSSFLAAFSGIIIVGFYAQASATMGAEYLLGSVAAVLVGGASIAGGRGSMIGTLGGALVLGQVATLVAVANLGSNIQQLIYGVIVLIVIALYARRGRD
jgi:ribose transport system permease protein